MSQPEELTQRSRLKKRTRLQLIKLRQRGERRAKKNLNYEILFISVSQLKESVDAFNGGSFHFRVSRVDWHISSSSSGTNIGHTSNASIFYEEQGYSKTKIICEIWVLQSFALSSYDVKSFWNNIIRVIEEKIKYRSSQCYVQYEYY